MVRTRVSSEGGSEQLSSGIGGSYGTTTGQDMAGGTASPPSSLMNFPSGSYDPGMQIELSAAVAGVVPDGQWPKKY